MKLREINERPEWTFWVPDSIADWDAPSHWERERLASMQALLEPGMRLFDIGTEHGWLSAVYGSFVGHENMVLVEPSPEFWPNIRLTWVCNEFPAPRATVQAFAGGESTGGAVAYEGDWPPCATGPEIGAMAYRYIHDHADEVPTITIDALTSLVGAPDAITIDIEGAELLALSGAMQTLREHRPLVWVSIHPDLMARDYGHLDTDLRRFVRDLGYGEHFIHHDHEEHWLFTPLERL